MELCEFSLDIWLKSNTVKNMSVQEWNGKVPGLWKDLLSGLNHLHTHTPKVFHRDIKVCAGVVLRCVSTSHNAC